MLMVEELALDSTIVEKDMNAYEDVGSKVLHLNHAKVSYFDWNNIVSVPCQSFKQWCGWRIRGGRKKEMKKGKMRKQLYT